MTFNDNIALVLEGGGMRGVFTSGVIDYMIDHDLRFSYGVGVSAGACNGLSFMSRQRDRARATNIDLLEQYRYIGLKYLWKQHSILDAATIYDKIPNEVLPFDYEACFANPMTFEMVTTDCRTGRPRYLTERHSRQRLLDIARASSSLPFVCPICDLTINGRRVPMLDGGIVDSIPLARAFATGHSRAIVVLTRHYGYRSTDRDVKMPRFIYNAYPRLRLALSKRHEVYNRQLAYVEEQERLGRAVVIRPRRPVEVGRLENDVKKLTRLYKEGYACARRTFSSLPEGFI